MTKEEVLAKRKAEWLKQERRDFIDAYTEEWESDRWIAEWEEQERALRGQWREKHPDGTEDDWEDWLNRQLIVWQVERREALREEAQSKWKEREPDYEKRWEAHVRETSRADERAERKSSIN